MIRKPLSTIIDRPVAFREPKREASQFEADCYRLNSLVMYDVATANVVGSVDRDDLFDEDGNRFDG